jgi:membrane protease YdiL (CAAX protease family)
MKKQFWITIKQFLLYLILSQGIMTLGIIILAIKSVSIGIEKNQEAISKFVSETTIAQWAVALGFALAIVVFLGKRYVRISTGRIERSTWGVVAFMAALVSLGWMFTEVSILQLADADKLFADDWEELEEFEKMMGGTLGAISVGILAPIAEEIGFRGVLMGGLLRMRCKPWVAIILSAIVFSFFHGTYLQLLGTMVFGIITGWLFWRTRSLQPGMIIHIVNNSTAVILEMFIPDWEPDKTACVMFIAVCLPILLIGLRWFKQSRYRSPQ